MSTLCSFLNISDLRFVLEHRTRSSKDTEICSPIPYKNAFQKCYFCAHNFLPIINTEMCFIISTIVRMINVKVKRMLKYYSIGLAFVQCSL